MFKVLAVAGRDFKSWTQNFSFYLMAIFFFGLTGYFFWSGISYFSMVSFQAATNPALQIRGLNLTEGVFTVFLANVSVLLLLLIPIFTMKSFAEEKKLGTLELLVTYPVSDFEIVAGKFIALFALVVALLLPTIAYFFLAGVIGARFETQTVIAGYGGLLLLTASFISLGMFLSSVTENQAISSGIGFAILLFFWVAGWIADWASPALGSVFRELSLIGHFQDMTRGIIDTKDVAYFSVFICFFLFATLSTLEIRTWKK